MRHLHPQPSTSSPRTLLRALARTLGCLALAVGTAVALPATATATATADASAASATVVPPGPALSFAPHGTPATRVAEHARTTSGLKNTVETYNWAGYAASSTKYTEVSANWSEPSASCGSSTTYVVFWVGLDGFNSGSVEQTGTLIECYDGTPYQYAWYEMYPAAPVYWNVSVSPGDTITAEVTSDSSGNFALTLADSRGWNEATTASNSSLARSSAEVITEAPAGSGGILPLADYGTVTFNGATVDYGTLSSSNPTNIEMITTSGDAETTCSSLYNGGQSFNCTWLDS
jgi:hypothetical protein